MTRGLRNNNPLNIRHSADQWQGARAHQTDPSFVQFENMAYGYRAAWKVLESYWNYFSTRGLHFNVRSIIGRWAPPHGERHGKLHPLGASHHGTGRFGEPSATLQGCGYRPPRETDRGDDLHGMWHPLQGGGLERHPRGLRAGLPRQAIVGKNETHHTRRAHSRRTGGSADVG
ncbi:MAG: hypothetical protein IKW43_09105 [Bacteroidaceae bacterium]|nr:hypothetical protein [Bacteroidaceae bacterium]